MARQLKDYSGFIHEEILQFPDAHDAITTLVVVEAGQDPLAAPAPVPSDFLSDLVDLKKPEN
jgi:hypothetical protein